MNDFTELIDNLSNGATANEAAHQLHLLVKAVQDTGKPGTLTLTITIAPKFGTDSPDLEITDKIKINQPTANRDSTLTWVDKRGHISLTNPRQDALPNITDITIRGDR
jgi:hypothetical protein